MDNALNELYQSVILEHSREPSNYGKLASCTHEASGVNPLCGDEVSVFLDVKDGVLASIRFEGQGCAISQASASLMTEALKQKPLEDVARIGGLFHELLGENANQLSDQDEDSLGDLTVMKGVRRFHSRIKCATLAWHTLAAALKGSHQFKESS